MFKVLKKIINMFFQFLIFPRIQKFSDGMDINDVCDLKMNTLLSSVTHFIYRFRHCLAPFPIFISLLLINRYDTEIHFVSILEYTLVKDINWLLQMYSTLRCVKHSGPQSLIYRENANCNKLRFCILSSR